MCVTPHLTRHHANTTPFTKISKQGQTTKQEPTKQEEMPDITTPRNWIPISSRRQVRRYAQQPDLQGLMWLKLSNNRFVGRFSLARFRCHWESFRCVVLIASSASVLGCGAPRSQNASTRLWRPTTATLDRPKLSD